METIKAEIKKKIMPNKESAEYEVVEQCLIIRLKEELDHHSAMEISQRTDFMIERGAIKDIIFDFSSVSFMDSSGIGIIMGRYKRVICNGGNVAVVHVGDSIDRILKLSGLYKIIKRCATVNDAMACLS